MTLRSPYVCRSFVLLCLFAGGLAACAGETGVGGAGGDSGGAGTTGDAGTAGGAGTSGGAGMTGVAGTTGASGTTGAAGTTGVAGAAGTGAAGRGGTTGAAGAAGTGVAGRGGTTGTAGAAGTGVAGRGGTTGTAGAAGTGVAGRGGTTGAAGSTGGRGGGAGGGAAGTGAAGTGAAGTGAAGSNNNGLVGWAAAGCPVSNVTTTTGGGNGTPVNATSWGTNMTDDTARVIQLSGTLTGDFELGSNKTLIGMPGATIRGSLAIDGSVNVIVRNLTVIGRNCSGVSSCEDGEDAVIIDGSHHVWLDHMAISDGSDGNLDIVNGSDCVTVSWSKFSYSSTGRDHRFSNLVGNSDNSPEDVNKLRVTWHHNWWADRVVERQPRVRYGRVHLFNNLWTSSGSNYCVGVGFFSNILVENGAFVGVSDPVDISGYSNDSSVSAARGNVGVTDNSANLRADMVFTPGYPYTLDAASGVQAAVMAGAGPR